MRPPRTTTLLAFAAAIVSVAVANVSVLPSATWAQTSAPSAKSPAPQTAPQPSAPPSSEAPPAERKQDGSDGYSPECPAGEPKPLQLLV
ncbi:MAG: hypothetical protein AAGC70_03475 [Pseudomonadota bacterium]